MPENDVIQYFEDAGQDIYQYPEIAVRLKNRKLKQRKKNTPLYGDLTLEISNVENLILPRELLTLPLDNNVSDTEKLKNFKEKLLALLDKNLILGLSEKKLEKLQKKINELESESPKLSNQYKKIKSIKVILEDEKVSIMPPGTREVVIGDLHGNFLKLIYTLLREGVISGIDQQDYKFLATFLTKGYDNIALVNQMRQKKYSQIINKIIIDPSSKIKLTLIGDVLRDRGPSDAFTLELISKLTTAPGHEKLEMDIIFSNHDLAFFNWYQTIESDKKFLQIKELESRFENYSQNPGVNQKLEKHRKELYATVRTTMLAGQENSNEVLAEQLLDGLVTTTQLEQWVNVYFSKLKLFSHSETVDNDASPIEKIKMHAQPNGLSVLKSAADWLLPENSLNVDTNENRKELTQQVNDEFQQLISSFDGRKVFRDKSVLDITRGDIQELLNNHHSILNLHEKIVALEQAERLLNWLEKKNSHAYSELKKTTEYQQLQLIMRQEINLRIERTFEDYHLWRYDPSNKKKNDIFLSSLKMLNVAIKLLDPSPLSEWKLKAEGTVEYIACHFFIMQAKHDLLQEETLAEELEAKLNKFCTQFADNSSARVDQINAFGVSPKQGNQLQIITSLPPCPLFSLIYERETKNSDVSTADEKKVQWVHGHVGHKVACSRNNDSVINLDSSFGRPETYLKNADNVHVSSETYRIGYSYDLDRYDCIKDKTELNEMVYHLIDYKNHLENTLTNLANKLEKKADDIEIRNKIFFKDTKDDAITKARELAKSLRANVDTLKIIKPESLLGQTSIPALQEKVKEIDMIKETSLDLFVNVINDKNNPLMKARGFSWIIKKGAEILGKIGNLFTSSNDEIMEQNAEANTTNSTLLNTDSNELASTKVCSKSVFFQTKSVKKIQNALEEINTFESILPTPRSSGIK